MARTHADPPDPRSIITPDAFSVETELLGLRLATPRRRLGAMLVDLVVVWLITLLLGGLGIALGVAAAAFFVWMATRKEGADRVFSWVFRAAVGCLGLFILLITAAVFWVVGSSGFLSDLDDAVPGARPFLEESIREQVTAEIREGLRAGVDERAFGEIRSADEARTALRETAKVAERMGLSAEETREILEGGIPEDQVPWGEEADAMVEAALVSAYGEPDEGRDAAEPPEGGEQGAATAALPPEAADSIATLLARLEDLEAERRALEIEVDARDETIDEMEEEIEETEEGGGGPGIWASTQGLAETAGIDFGFFGWFVLYFAFVMPRLGGRTLGKRLFGIRVLQLDGSPMNWFEAFERAGGYAAGFATGLLGFAQVYWDPNRQGIHDKIAGTVVVDERKPRVPGLWEKAAGPDGRTDTGPERRAGPGPEKTR